MLRGASRGGKITGPKNLLTYEARSRGAAVLRAKPAAERAEMFQKGWATRRANAAAAQRAEAEEEAEEAEEEAEEEAVEAEEPGGACAELEAEGRAMDTVLAALQERALPKLASLMDELAKAAA
jgi:hypothetical protein